MKTLRLVSLPLLLMAATAVHAQSTEIEVNDGTTATCYRSTGASPCGFFTAPTIDSFVTDGAGQASEIMTTANGTSVQTTNGTSTSGLNIVNDATALESFDPGSGYAGAGTQTGTSSITGLQSGQFVATANNNSNQDSSLQLEGTVGLIRTLDSTTGTFGFLQTSSTGTILGYSGPGGAALSTITSTASGHALVGNTGVTGTLAVSGTSTLNGIDNQTAGITNAGLVSGVTAGVVSATSQDAVNGSQLFVTNTNVTTAQATADTAIANAAVAQSTADTALTNAATAQVTADTAVANAATAQTTADTALSNATAAQTNANTAIAQSSSAQTTANSAYRMASGFDGRISSLESTVHGFDRELQRVDRTAGRGIAIATALASMPDLEPGKRMGLGIGVGSYDGHNAVSAAFVVRASDNAKFRINGGTAGEGKFAFGAGGMFSW